MKDLKPLIEILGKDDESEELYSSEQKKRGWRAQKGRYSREKGLFSFLLLIKQWEELVGKMMAENTIPLKIKGKTLIVSTRHAIFAQELSFLAPQILEKIKEKFPELEAKVNKIKFTYSDYSAKSFSNEKIKADPKKASSKPGRPHRFSPLYQRRMAKAKDYFSHIEDPEVKEILMNFMINHGQE